MQVDDEIWLIDLDAFGPCRRQNVLVILLPVETGAESRIDLRQRPSQDARRFRASAK